MYENDGFVRAAVLLDVEDADVVFVFAVLMDVVLSCVVPVVGRYLCHVRDTFTDILNSVLESRLDDTA